MGWLYRLKKSALRRYYARKFPGIPEGRNLPLENLFAEFAAEPEARIRWPQGAQAALLLSYDDLCLMDGTQASLDYGGDLSATTWRLFTTLTERHPQTKHTFFLSPGQRFSARA